MRICFLLGVAVWTALSAQAADPAGPAARVVVRADPRSGRLVRSVVVSPKKAVPQSKDSAGTQAGAPGGITEIVNETARENHVDPLLVHSVIQVESNYNPYAISPKGAEGLMQLIPSTARRYGAHNSFSAKENIEAGVKYLKHLQELYGDLRLALAAYNAGEAAVSKYGWIPPYPETQNYVNQVGKRYGEARRSAEKKVSAAASKQEPAPVVAPADRVQQQHPKLEQFVDEQGRIHLRTK